jgi:hypothetical protein
MLQARAIVLLIIGLCGGGCGLFGKTVTVVPVGSNRAPLTQARVSVNGVPAGQGTTDVKVKDEAVNVTITAGDGWLPESFSISKATESPLTVPLQVDEAYRATQTDTNQLVNRWLNLNVSETAKATDEWWAAVTASIAGQDFELEMMDPRSGFIRSAWKEKRFQQSSIRRRFIGNIVGQNPLRFRIKYEVERREGEADWEPYKRGFRADLDTLQEMQTRITK